MYQCKNINRGPSTILKQLARVWLNLDLVDLGNFLTSMSEAIKACYSLLFQNVLVNLSLFFVHYLPLVHFECQVAAVRMEEVVLKIPKVEGKPHLM